jgi:hypothetical protein
VGDILVPPAIADLRIHDGPQKAEPTGKNPFVPLLRCSSKNSSKNVQAVV